MEQLYAINKLMIRWGKKVQSPLLMVIRLFWGYWYLRGSIIKFTNMDDLITYFDSLSIPLPAIMAVLTAILHFTGGLSMIFGFCTRLISVPLIISMVVAYFAAELHTVTGIFDSPIPFIMAAPFLFLYANLVLLAFGPGKFSVDNLLEEHFRK